MLIRLNPFVGHLALAGAAVRPHRRLQPRPVQLSDCTKKLYTSELAISENILNKYAAHPIERAT